MYSLLLVSSSFVSTIHIYIYTNPSSWFDAPLVLIMSFYVAALVCLFFSAKDAWTIILLSSHKEQCEVCIQFTCTLFVLLPDTTLF